MSCVNDSHMDSHSFAMISDTFVLSPHFAIGQVLFIGVRDLHMGTYIQRERIYEITRGEDFALDLLMLLRHNEPLNDSQARSYYYL